MKFHMRKIQFIVVAIAMVSVFASCSKDEDDPAPESKNIVQTAVGDPQFSILAEALTKANLVSALEGTGPFTVFAPTNEAFNALFEQLGVSGLDDLSADALTPILLYHVVSGNVVSSQVSTGSVPTLKEGSNINVEVSGMGVKLNNNTNVIATDVQGSNGVIHAIDAVLLPM